MSITAITKTGAVCCDLCLHDVAFCDINCKIYIYYDEDVRNLNNEMEDR